MSKSDSPSSTKSTKPTKSTAHASRRKFLGQMSGAAASTIAVSAIGLEPLLGVEGSIAEAVEISPTPCTARVTQADQIRRTAADNEAALGCFSHPTNGDEELYANKNFFANFTKTLPHNDLGEVDPIAYQALLNALSSGNFIDFENVPKGGTLTYLNPMGGLAFNMEGPDSPATSLVDLSGNPLVPPAFASAQMAAQVVEIYWEAVTRDVPFANYSTDPLIAKAVADMNKLTAFQGPKPVTPDNLFRYNYPGALVGPLISQFLLKPFRFDGIPSDGRTRLPKPVIGNDGIDFLTFYDEWLCAQRGFPAPGNPFGYPVCPIGAQVFFPDTNLLWPHSGRDLGQVASQDAIYSTYFRAALILLGFGNAALDNGNPYKTSTRQGGFATLGFADLLRLVGSAHEAERHTWYHKWNVHRYLRPEAMGGRVHNHLTKKAKYPIHKDVLMSSVLDEVFNYNALVNQRRGVGGGQGTFLLPQMAPAGVPTHPSAPAGHAISAGACCTILKAFFDENFPIPTPKVPDATGTTLNDFTGPTLTIGGELNKLTHNMTEGRNEFGVHWRQADNLSGNLQGEEVAIRILQEAKATYAETFTFSLTKFNGTTITI